MTETSAVDQSVCRYPACQSSGGCNGICAKRSNLDRSNRERVAAVLDRSYPKVAAKIRAGMRSSNWPEDLVDPGTLIDLLEQSA